MTTSKPEKTVASQEPARQLIAEKTAEFLARGGKIMRCTKGHGVNPQAYRAFT